VARVAGSLPVCIPRLSNASMAEDHPRREGPCTLRVVKKVTLCVAKADKPHSLKAGMLVSAMAGINFQNAGML